MKHDCQVKIIEPENWDRFSESPCGFGAVFTDIEFWEEGKVWYATNDEYSTIIYYCPWCGVKL